MENVDKYISLVCDFFRLKEEDVKSKSRYHRLCEARQIISYILRKHTNLSLNEIADLLNYRDHASPWRDSIQVTNFLEIEQEFRERITPLLKAAEDLSDRMNKIEDKIRYIPDPGDICWFWNDFFQDFPKLGTFLQLNQNGDECKYISAEEPELGYSHCEFAGEHIIPAGFKRPVPQESNKTNNQCKLSTSHLYRDLSTCSL